MGLLDGLEKLINEHGSATILKERISLANDKYSDVQEQNKILSNENSKLKEELQKLAIESEEKDEIIQNLKTELNANNETTLEFNPDTGTWFEEKTSLHYCSKCKASNTLSPLKNGQYGWFCIVCGRKYSDPERPKPKPKKRPPSSWRIM